MSQVPSARSHFIKPPQAHGNIRKRRIACARWFNVWTVPRLTHRQNNGSRPSGIWSWTCLVSHRPECTYEKTLGAVQATKAKKVRLQLAHSGSVMLFVQDATTPLYTQHIVLVFLLVYLYVKYPIFKFKKNCSIGLIDVCQQAVNARLTYYHIYAATLL